MNAMNPFRGQGFSLALGQLGALNRLHCQGRLVVLDGDLTGRVLGIGHEGQPLSGDEVDRDTPSLTVAGAYRAGLLGDHALRAIIDATWAVLGGLPDGEHLDSCVVRALQKTDNLVGLAYSRTAEQWHEARGGERVTS